MNVIIYYCRNNIRKTVYNVNDEKKQ